MGGVHKGMGKPMLPTIATLIFMCLIRFPWVWFVFPLFSGPNTLTYLYLIWPIGWILSITTLVIGYFPAMKKIKRGI
jgi:Na+-driven multidrug efflux pump